MHVRGTPPWLRPPRHPVFDHCCTVTDTFASLVSRPYPDLSRSRGEKKSPRDKIWAWGRGYTFARYRVVYMAIWSADSKLLVIRLSVLQLNLTFFFFLLLYTSYSECSDPPIDCMHQKSCVDNDCMDGFQMSIERPTSGGQAHAQEATVQQIFHLERSSFYLSALMVRTQRSAY